MISKFHCSKCFLFTPEEHSSAECWACQGYSSYDEYQSAQTPIYTTSTQTVSYNYGGIPGLYGTMYGGSIKKQPQQNDDCSTQMQIKSLPRDLLNDMDLDVIDYCSARIAKRKFMDMPLGYWCLNKVQMPVINGTLSCKGKKLIVLDAVYAGENEWRFVCKEADV